MVTHAVGVRIKTWGGLSLKQTGNILFLTLDSVDLDLFCCVFNFIFRLYTLLCTYEIFNNSFKERKVKQTSLCLKSFNNIDLISGLQIFGTCPSLWKKGSGMIQRKECYTGNQEMWDMRYRTVRTSEANLLYYFKQMDFYYFPCLQNERNQTYWFLRTFLL